MDETALLKLLQQDPENEQARQEYFAWLVESGDHRARYVQLSQDRIDARERLQKLDHDIRCFPGINEEWLEVVFPLRIRSQSVGRVYLRPNPTSPPFVEVGKFVGPSTVVCLIEVMYTLQEVTADVDGVVDQVTVKDGEAVEYNQVLFRLKRPPDPLAFF